MADTPIYAHPNDAEWRSAADSLVYVPFLGKNCRKTAIDDWPPDSFEARMISDGDEVYITGPKADYGDGNLRHPIFVKPKDWIPGDDAPLPRPAPSKATIYFIGPDNGPIKIGFASRLDKRLRDLQLANALPIKLWASVEGPLSLEREYHRQFAAHRLHGEWFTRCPEIEEEIARLSLNEGGGNG